MYPDLEHKQTGGDPKILVYAGSHLISNKRLVGKSMAQIHDLVESLRLGEQYNPHEEL